MNKKILMNDRFGPEERFDNSIIPIHNKRFFKIQFGKYYFV